MDPNTQNPQGDSSAVQPPAVPPQTTATSMPTPPPPSTPEETVPTPPPDTSNLTVNQSMSTPETPKKGSPLMIVAIILAVIALLAVVAYVFGARFLNTQPVSTPISTIAPPILPTVKPTETPLATGSGIIITASPSATPIY